MEITPNPSTSQVTLTTPAAAIRSWAVGQLLNAVAMEESAGGLVTLRVGNANVAADVPFGVKIGQNFMLEVISLGELPVLQVVRPDPGADPYQAILRAALPRQSGLPPLLANLAALAGKGGQMVEQSLPAQVAQVLRALMDALSKSSDVATARGLQRALQDSGVFLESKLAREAGQPGDGRRAATATDFKAGLLRLRATLRNTEPLATSSTRAQPSSGDPRTSSPESSTAKPPASNPPAEAPPTAPATPKPSAATARLPLPTPMRGAPGAAAEKTVATTPQAPQPRQSPPPGSTVANTPPTPAVPERGSTPLLPPLQNIRPQPQASVQAALSGRETPAQTVASLLNQVEGALARLHLTQLASHTAATDGRQVWLAEIPVRQGTRVDVFQMRVEREESSSKKGRSADQPAWSMELAFDLPGLGPVHARVGVLGERASTTFWAEQADTAQLFSQHLAELRQRLETAGLVADRLLCHLGAPPVDTLPPAAGQSLLDEEA